MSQQLLDEQEATLKRARHYGRMSIICAGVSFALAITSICLSIPKPTTLPKQNIQAIQCISSNGNLETYHIHIPRDIMNPANFIAGFCNSI